MEWRRLTGKVEGVVRDVSWWVTLSPFCVATYLSALGASETRALQLAGSSEQYPVTELLGRLWAFRGRIRFARALLILPRALVICGIILVIARSAQIFSQRPPWAWLPVVLFLILGWAFHVSIHHEISSFEVARLVDRRVGLQAQLATAVEYTLSHRLDQPLVRTQIRHATNRIRELDPREVVPLVWPGPDLRALAVVVVLYGAATLVGSLGLTIPRPLQPIDAELAKLASQEAQAPSPYVTMDSAQTQILPNAVTADQLPPQLRTLQQELKSNAITQEQYQAQLQDLQKQLQAQANQSLASQQALNALAAALKDSSTTRAISDSLARGDYQDASSKLNDLSQQIDKLSPDARSELASHLSQAAAQTRQLNQSMSQSSQQAADALKQGDNAQASQAMQSLSRSVQEASNQISAQAQLGQAMQQVQQNLGNQQSPDGNQASQNGQSAQAAQNEQNGQSTDSANSSLAQSQDQNGNSGTGQSALDRQSDGNSGDGSQQSGQGNGSGQPSTSQQIQQDQTANSGGAGSSPGSNLLDSKPTPLDVGGVKLSIQGQASDTGNGQTSAGDRSSPLTGADGSTISAAGTSSGTSSNVPINAHQESNVVPLEMKPVVREYFSNGGQ